MRYVLTLLALLAIGFTALKNVRLETDFSAFLPPSSTPQQRLLIAQLRDGVVSRLMLIALDRGNEAGKKTANQTANGGRNETGDETSNETELARASSALAGALSGEPEFDYAANGNLEQFRAQGEVLMRERYALSPNVTAATFSVPALRAALEEQLAQLASPMGVVTRATMARDPTGEFFNVLRGLSVGAGPALRQGVWMSADGRRAFLIAQTKAAGFDSDRQRQALDKVLQSIARVAPGVKVTVTGPGVFAAESQRVIERDARLLSLASAVVVLAILIFVYRSALTISLVLVPVAFGLGIGVLLVQWMFGYVHAITLAFAATLMGEAVDYPSYLLLNAAADEPAARASRRIARTLTLAVLTTVASAIALTLSGFQGLAQLGVLTMAGVLVAGAVTLGVLPRLLRGPIRHRRIRVPVVRLNSRWPAWGLTVITLVSVAALAWTHPAWWERDLGALSPASAQMREIDANLRREMGAPEVALFAASRGASEADALSAAEKLTVVLTQWKENKRITDFDTPTTYLPSPSVQAERREALPEPGTLEKNLREALRGTAFRAGAFEPFLKDVEAARGEPPVTRATYAGTALGAKLNAQVMRLDGEWLVLTSLSGIADAGALASELTAKPELRTELVDLRQLSTQMLDDYRGEALHQAGWGALLILVLLVVGLGSPRRAVRVAAPALAAVVLTAAVIVVLGTKLSVFHLVALLLVLGIGLNYALFFERPGDAAERERARLSLAVCSVSAIATFGFLALSSTPVLRAIGATVALGAVLSLVLSAAWASADSSPSPSASTAAPA